MSGEGDVPFIDTVEGEISFYRSVMRTRPVGIHSQFHVLCIRNAIIKETGQSVSIQQIWDKLKSLYDMDALEGLVSLSDYIRVWNDIMTPNQFQENDDYDSGGSDSSAPSAIPSPSPSQNLSTHPFFRQEYTLPVDDTFELLISARRVRDSESPPSSPPVSSSPATRITRGGRTRRSISKSEAAGLVGGDSDSSALTQESGDENEGANTKGSVATGTEPGSENEEDSEEAREESPGMYIVDTVPATPILTDIDSTQTAR